LLVLWCVGGRCGMAGSDEDRLEVGDLVQRTKDGHIGRVLDGRTIGRSGDIMCGLHHACGDKERGFLV
jgi:hypothetical protein